MPATRPRKVFRLIYLPQTPDGKPAEQAVRHLAEFDENGRFVRFHRQKTSKLLLADGGAEIVEERQLSRRIKRYIETMKSRGFYKDR